MLDITTMDSPAIKTAETAIEKLLREALSQCLPHVGAALEACAKYLDEQERSLKLRWDAQSRAIKSYHDAHPGNDFLWPDHADLCVWLLEQLEAKADQKSCCDDPEAYRLLNAALYYVPKPRQLHTEIVAYLNRTGMAQISPSTVAPKRCNCYDREHCVANYLPPDQYCRYTAPPT